ncbi:hypothetical protein EMIHUDRAFT_207625 [Emiliania huxleyi CCMP1516]|uniref:F5/8 type C domain-containing protein n=2 Tax=Emiliania huxleyi TaxID=2903 RepID=A0A0D3JDR5_EMIH1|nr:hypothetical protein EMIHUDRAFT_207625 [Emiliania huxleyi CCMP1516]EOD21650.1 hypothetical protein EMIHUDRAFT_207625 [Emiliania huxleyi CCMP1516]|eukprot:XP_005774079.1 hypothetical protein EMIHUDRAFT_207625 [Emiliania huxleyi CCMP1516]
MIDEKPFSDVRRARFERGGKRAWLGKSVRRVDRYEATSHADKTAEVKPSNEWSQGCVGDGEPENRRLVSALECTLDDMPCTLDKDGAWEWLPALLAEHAIQPPSLVKSKVEVRREGCPSRAEARQAAARRCQPRGGAIYRMRNKRTPAPFATPPSEAPEGVQGALLTPKRVGGRGGRHASAAVVRANRVEAAWDVERAGGVGTKNAFIEIDLGQNCDLTEVLAIGEGSLAGSPWAASGYAVSPPPRHYTDLQWVTRYEVSVREAGGRAWRSLGVHRGNDDATSEVVHSLSQFKGGVRARFGRAYAPKSGNKCGCACCLRYPPRPSRTSRKAELRSAVNGPRCEECE